MKFLVMSDAHGGKNIVNYLVSNIPEIDGYIYLGDTLDDIKEGKQLTDKPFYAVKGNCDLMHTDFAKEEEIIEIYDQKILICHGHRYDVKNQKQSLYYKALSENVNLVLYGHTHVVEDALLGDIIFFNPGSLTRPKKNKKPSYGIIEVKKEEISRKIIFFNSDEIK